jgi:hypothetical protein
VGVAPGTELGVEDAGAKLGRISDGRVYYHRPSGKSSVFIELHDL